jgi:hypothetical protein
MKANIRRAIFLAHLIAVLSLFASPIQGIALADNHRDERKIANGSFEGTVASYDSSPENRIVRVTRKYGPTSFGKPEQRPVRNDRGEVSMMTVYTKQGSHQDTYWNIWSQSTTVTLNWQVSYTYTGGIYSIIDEALMYQQGWNNGAHLPIVSVNILKVKNPSTGAWTGRNAPSAGTWELNYGIVSNGNSSWAGVEVGYDYNLSTGQSTVTAWVP